MRRTKFSDEFKRDAVAQITERGYPVRDVAERFNVSQYSLYSWKKKFAKASSGDAEKDAEIRRLKKELARVSELAKPSLRQPASPRLVSTGRPPDRTSRREPPAAAPMRYRSGYSETQPSLPSRSPREHEQFSPPKGAKGRAPRALRSRGCSVIELYNTVRPHSALGYRPPAPETIVAIDRRPTMH